MAEVHPAKSASVPSRSSLKNEATEPPASEPPSSKKEKDDVSAKPPPAEVVRVRVRVNNEREEVIEFSSDCSTEEVRSVFLAAAELPESCVGLAVLRLTGPHGELLPIGPHLASNVNSPDGAYNLEVRGENASNVNAIEATLNEALNLSEEVTLEDVLDLRRNVEQLTKKLDNYEKHPPLPAPTRKKNKPARTDPNYMTKPKYVLTEDTQKYLKQPCFDNWSWDDNEIIGLLEYIFVDLGLVAEYNIEVYTLRKFIGALRDMYNNNPFHNFRHCFCVTQMMYAIIHTTGAVNELKIIDKLVLVLAAVGHDLDHPGYNNAYQINAKTDLAIIYNDVSVLENHHAAVLFTILKDPETNILKNVPDSVCRDARKGIIKCILATDMAKHGEILTAFKKITETFSYNDAEHKALLLQVIIKCSDISNEVRPTSVAEPWVDCLLSEFFSQSDREKLEGLPTAPFMDREKVTKAGAQVGFIAYVMIPLFELAGKVLPNMEESIITPIKSSLTYYKNMMENK